MEHEDLESEFEFLSGQEAEIIQKMVRLQERKFSEGCMEGFKLLKKHGNKSLDSMDIDSAKEALSRMLGYFIQFEHYEKCSYIQQIYREIYNEEITPFFPKFLA